MKIDAIDTIVAWHNKYWTKILCSKSNVHIFIMSFDVVVYTTPQAL